MRSERFEKRSIPYYIPVVGASIPSPAIPSPDPAGVGPQSYSSWGAQFGISLRPPVRRSKKRDAAVKVAGDPVLLEEATSALRDLTGNEGSTKAASARLSTYAQIVSAAGLVPFPTSQSAVMCYLAAAVAAKYKNIEPTVSDVLGSPDAPPDVAPSANAILSRLRRKGFIGQKNQKRPIALRIIATQSLSIRTKCYLLLGFFGALRKREAAALRYTKSPAPGEIGIKLEKGPQHSSDSLRLDFSNFQQKGGPKVARFSRVKCTCCHQSLPAGGGYRLCLVHCSELRKVLFTISPGDIDLTKAVEELGLPETASHSLRIGAAV